MSLGNAKYNNKIKQTSEAYNAKAFHWDNGVTKRHNLKIYSDEKYEYDCTINRQINQFK